MKHQMHSDLFIPALNDKSFIPSADITPLCASGGESQACKLFFYHIMATRHDHCVGIFKEERDVLMFASKLNRVMCILGTISFSMVTPLTRTTAYFLLQRRYFLPQQFSKPFNSRQRTLGVGVAAFWHIHWLVCVDFSRSACYRDCRLLPKIRN